MTYNICHADELRLFHKELATEEEPLRALLASTENALQELSEREHAVKRGKMEVKREKMEVSAASGKLRTERELFEKQRRFVAERIEAVCGPSNAASGSGSGSSGVVKLNVGGTPFTTTLSTLTSEPDSMLGAMFSGRHEVRGAVLEDGSIFLDRSARMFHHVLSWLRDRTVSKQLSEEEKELLLTEGEFFCLRGLVSACRLEPVHLPRFTIPPGDIQCLGKCTGHRDSVTSIVSFDGPGNQICLASGSGDSTIKVWNASNGNLLRTLSGHIYTVCSLSVFTSAENQLCLASGSNDATIKIWNLSSGELLRTLAGHNGSVWSLAVFTSGENQLCLASGDCEGTITIWNPSDGGFFRTFSGGHTDAVCALAAFAIAENHPRLASGSADRTLKIWDPSTGGLIRTLSGHTDTVRALVSFTPAEGQLSLASGSSDGTINVWNPSTGNLLRTLGGHTGIVRSLAAFSDAENRVCLLSGGGWSAIKMWNPSTGEVLRNHSATTPHDEEGDHYDHCPPRVNSVVFFRDSRDRECFACGHSNNGTIKVWG